jgi:hypothetical protein
MRRSLASIFLLVLISPVLFAQAPSGAKEEKVFAAVPQHLRARLIERLNLYVEYERTKQYGKLYDLLWVSVTAPMNLSREAYVDASKKTIAKGYRSVLLEFKPTDTLNLSLNDEDIVRYDIWGTARVDDGEKVFKRDAAIEARWINGDWYFSGVADVILD